MLHPSYTDLINAVNSGVEPGAEATILAPARLLSQVIGQGRSNLRWLEERFGLKSVKVIADPVEKVENLHLRIAKSG